EEGDAWVQGVGRLGDPSGALVGEPDGGAGLVVGGRDPQEPLPGLCLIRRAVQVTVGRGEVAPGDVIAGVDLTQALEQRERLGEAGGAHGGPPRPPRTADGGYPR